MDTRKPTLTHESVNELLAPGLGTLGIAAGGDSGGNSCLLNVFSREPNTGWPGCGLDLGRLLRRVMVQLRPGWQ